MNDEQTQVNEFVAKVDAFAESLTAAEQAMLADLVTRSDDDDDEVSGFGYNTGWPGLTTLAPLKLGTDGYGFQSSGGGAPIVFRSEGDGFASTGSASPTV